MPGGMAPGVASGVSPTSAIGDAMVGSSPAGNADAMQTQLQGTMGKIRAINQQAEALAAEQPALAPIMQQIGELLKAAVVASAKAGMQQTASGMAVPGGGMTA